MKNKFYLILAGLIALFSLQSCDNHKTYGELVDEEQDAIKAFIAKKDIEVISKNEFFANDTVTTGNQYVFFEDKGIYMHIDFIGEGESILPDGTYDILSRFIEISIDDIEDMHVQAGDTLVRNMHANEYPGMQLKPEEYKVIIQKQNYSGTFQGTSLMFQQYDGMTAVPTGWLFPLQFIKPTRTNEAAKLARVRLIVPHSEGTQFAARFVYPCYYEITYNLGK